MTVSTKFCRRLSPKVFAYSAISVTVLLCIYYASYTTDYGTKNGNFRHSGKRKEWEKLQNEEVKVGKSSFLSSKEEFVERYLECPKLSQAEADVNTVEVFKDFEFQPSWMKTKEYWDKSFDDRYERQKMDPERPPLKVIIVPHSHNDPGWLKTFENYFHYTSRQIMNHMVSKLQQHKNLTFIWSETAFLNAWWEEAHPSKQRALKNLVKSGRLEIVTGGWVMTDEANAHVFAMVDQLIEGHQWVLSNLGVKPKSGWSVDPFGHGSTVPYLLAKSGIKGTVIQRIHYAWKQWLALKQYGDFRWIPQWSPSDPSGTLLTHNQPFDIYSIKHSCGPHPYICLNFDFRKVVGEYTEYSIKAQEITDKNIKQKSELLLEQYARTGSLFPHNVVLIPLGDDFRYNVLEEWDQQYTNYMKLINYINANKDVYKAEVKFGTPHDYFEEITKRFDQFPTLKGDFFVYSDIFSEGRPAYWSGYFTTRPFMKLLDRELEHNLRSAEILYTIAFNVARQNKLKPHIKILERDFEGLVKSRRNLGLFQHHDAITGTSKSFVMRDYGLKLFEGIRDTIRIQQNALQSLLFPNIQIKSNQDLILSDMERESYDKMAKKFSITIGPEQTRKVLLYNSLSQPQEHVIKLRTNTSNVKILDNENNDVQHQISPVWDSNQDNTRMMISKTEFEIIFIAKLSALSVSTYTVVYSTTSSSKLSTIYCNKCQREPHVNSDHSPPPQEEPIESIFTLKNIPPGDIQLENHKLKILFNGNTGLLKTVTRKHNPKIMQCGIHFGAYRSAQFHSGAYLFMPDPNEREIEKDVLQGYKDQMSILITSGSVYSELTVIYGPFLVHSVTIFHDDTSVFSAGLNIENTIDFENPPKNRETEMFMRIISDVQNGEPPEFYTDSNGFQTQRHIKIERIGIEGNYFPITTMAYIQDENIRLSLLTTHAQGAASWQPGFLEVMLDRRTLYDDSRGMGEGIVDNYPTLHRFWLLIEDISVEPALNTNLKRFENGDDNFEKGEVLRYFNSPTESTDAKQERYSRPSLYSNHLSNSLIYPANVYLLDPSYQDYVNSTIELVNKQFPCDVHLMNLRTQPDSVYSQFPSNSALLVLHRQGYDCMVSSNYTCNATMFNGESSFKYAKVKNFEVKSLTGIETLAENVSKLADIYIESMSIKTLNVTFE
ncbi:alpha-mannosidase 2 [Coccinella septempunctata]|uniref:alpha-mannosidase 2 n=1 Tax=Coccinella septempunctata TaxID=41139 RepID=UPI001D061F58|nr:alpha-mannosidase 2 [Coccinella septempunctata]XP_044752524.1 alpha-mannosidase 2 [Coccinella septempunctata]